MDNVLTNPGGNSVCIGPHNMLPVPLSTRRSRGLPRWCQWRSNKVAANGTTRMACARRIAVVMLVKPDVPRPTNAGHNSFAGVAPCAGSRPNYLENCAGHCEVFDRYAQTSCRQTSARHGTCQPKTAHVCPSSRAWSCSRDVGGIVDAKRAGLCLSSDWSDNHTLMYYG